MKIRYFKKSMDGWIKCHSTAHRDAPRFFDRSMTHMCSLPITFAVLPFVHIIFCTQEDRQSLSWYNNCFVHSYIINSPISFTTARFYLHIITVSYGASKFENLAVIVNKDIRLKYFQESCTLGCTRSRY